MDQNYLSEETPVSSTPQAEPVKPELSGVSRSGNVPMLPAPKRHLVRWIVIAVIVLVILGLLYMYRGTFVVALIDGKPISRLALVHELEHQSGAQMLDTIINQMLVEKKAAEAGIEIKDEEIDKAIEDIRTNLSSQQMTLEDALAQQKMTVDLLRKNIRLQKLAEKLVENQLSVTDEELATYMQQNKDFLPPADSPEAQKSAVQDMLRQQKFASVFQAWLNNAKTEANISYWKKY